MDLKGITWVGHVYQKFEAMCLEVEEIMYQDTVKYVENQVETVGSTVKKFYSDVVEDLLPPSSIDLVKGAIASNLPPGQNADVGICKKPKVGVKEEAVKVDKEQLSDSLLVTANFDKCSGHEQSFHGFHIEDTAFQPSSLDTVKVLTNVTSKEYGLRSGRNQSRRHTQKISKVDNSPPSKKDGATPHMERGLCRVSSSGDLLDKNQEASDDHVAVNPTSFTTEVASCKSFEETYDELQNASNGASGILNSSTGARDCDESKNLDAYSSCSSLSAELVGMCTSNEVGSFVNEDVHPSEFPDLDFTGRSDYSTVDAIESSIDVEQGFETIQRIDNVQVEETCVLVNGNELCFVPRKECKNRPYKKKIQDAISSRMRSARKHEYKQLAVWYGEDENSKQGYAETKGTPSHGYCESESEWELL